MAEEIIKRYGQRVGYTDAEIETFHEGGHRIRHVRRLSKAAPLYSIEAEVVEARPCNSGHKKGQRCIMDVDGNFSTNLFPKSMCVYLVSPLTIPVALINARLSAGHAPNAFTSMRFVIRQGRGVQ